MTDRRTVDNCGDNVDKVGRKVGVKKLPDGRVAPGRGPAVGSPNAGRPPDAWKALCRELASRDAVLEAARRVLENPEHPAWLGAWKWLGEQGYGKATQQIEMSGDGGLTIRVVRESRREGDGA